MKSLLTDSVVLICAGVILIGFVGLLWAIAKLRRWPGDGAGKAPADDFLSVTSDLGKLDLGGPAVSRAPLSAFSPSSASSPAVSRDVAERLDSMTQRLAEMQALLSKQASSASTDAGGPAGSMGQGFSPETIDKLLKIIGNVVQQVDILQKNLNPGKEGTGAKLENPAAPLGHP